MLEATVMLKASPVLRDLDIKEKQSMGALSNFQVRWAYKQNKKKKKKEMKKTNKQTNIVAEIKAVMDIAGAISRTDMCVFQ